MGTPAPTIQLLKVEQVAAALQVGVSTAYKLVAQGRIKGVKLGSGDRAAVRVHPDELERFQREGSVEGR